MSDRRDVTGVWYGGFGGEEGVTANRFIALLGETDGRISGSISEPDELGEVDLLRAVVSGAREGGEVRFVKQYDGAAHAAHAVDYAGRIDAEGTEIAGEWRFAGYSGSFVMRREQFGEEMLVGELVVALDDDTGR